VLWENAEPGQSWVRSQCKWIELEDSLVCDMLEIVHPFTKVNNDVTKTKQTRTLWFVLAFLWTVLETFRERSILQLICNRIFLLRFLAFNCSQFIFIDWIREKGRYLSIKLFRNYLLHFNWMRISGTPLLSQ